MQRGRLSRRENHRRSAPNAVSHRRFWPAFAALVLAAPALPATAADEPGQRFSIQFDELPAPGATPSARNAARAVRQPADAALAVPDGFEVNVFALGLSHARWLVVAANGDVFVAEPNAGRVTLLRDTDGDGRADTGGVFVSGLERPHGMAISGGYFYVTTPRDIFRIPYTPGDSQASGPAEIVGARLDALNPRNRHEEVPPDEADQPLDLALVVALARPAEPVLEQIVRLQLREGPVL